MDWRKVKPKRVLINLYQGGAIMDWRKVKDMAIVLLLVIPVVCFLFGAWFTPSASAAPIKMRVQTAAPNVSLSYKSVVWLADAVREMSDGRLDIEVLPAGAIVPTARIPSAVDKGLVEAGATYAQYLGWKAHGWCPLWRAVRGWRERCRYRSVRPYDVADIWAWP